MSVPSPAVVDLKYTATNVNNTTTQKHEVDTAFEHDLQSNISFNPCDDLQMLVENQKEKSFKETIPSKWAFEDFPLTPSPLVRTPPYEYIFLTKENEPKFRIYLNPKMDQVFKKELASLKKHNSPEISSKRDLSVPSWQDKIVKIDDGDINENNNLSTESPSLLNTKSSITIHCFDPSDMELELKHIFIENPPITHKIVRRKPRKERGSSVAGIDSYYGTKDLAKVGHASYFIPALTLSERKAIGWKEEYCYGRWKYNTPNIGSIQKSISGHLRLLRSTLSIKANKSNHSHSHHNRPTSTSKSRGAPSNHSHLTLPTPCTGTSKESNMRVSKDTEDDDDNDARHIVILPHENIPSTSKAGQIGSSLVNHYAPRRKHVIRRFFTWLVPCIGKFKKLTTEEGDNQSSCGSSESDYRFDALESNPNQKGKAASGHHHRHHTIGCFSRHHHHKKNFIGGDIIVSTDESIASISMRQDLGGQQPHPKPTLALAIPVPTPILNNGPLEALESRMGDDVNEDSMMYETIETVFEIQEHSLENNASALVVRLLNADKTSSEQSIEPNERAEAEEGQLQNNKKYIETSDIVERNIVLRDQNHNLDQATSVSTVGYSTIPSTCQVSPSTQLSSPGSLSPFSYYEEHPEMYHDHEDVDEQVSVSDMNFIPEFIQKAMNHHMPEKVYQSNPPGNYSTMPETRFLDMKDLRSPRYLNADCSSSLAGTFQNHPDSDYDYYEQNESILWSDEDDDDDKLTTDDVDDDDGMFNNYENIKWTDEDDSFLVETQSTTSTTNINGVSNSNLLMKTGEDKFLDEISDNNSNVPTK